MADGWKGVAQSSARFAWGLLSHWYLWVGSYEIARAIGVTQKTAWLMMLRIRLAMHGNNDGAGSVATWKLLETTAGRRSRENLLSAAATGDGRS